MDSTSIQSNDFNFIEFTSPAVADFWRNFCYKHSASFPEDISYAGELHFEARGFLNDELLLLVLAGKKTSLFESLATYLADSQPLPVSGEYYVVLDRAENPQCVIELQSVAVVPFGEVTWQMAQNDAADENLEAWRTRMREQLEEDGELVGFEFSSDLKLVCQTFRVAYK